MNYQNRWERMVALGDFDSSHSPSSGERKGISLNRCTSVDLSIVYIGVVR